MNKAYKFSQKSTISKFDQSYRQKYEHLCYQIDINRFTIKFILTLYYLFNITDDDIFFYIFVQT